MGAAEAIRKGRAAAARYMAQIGTTVSITRDTGALDPETFDPVRSEVYAGPGRVQTYEAQERDVEVGGGQATIQRYAVHVPVGAYVPKPNDLVTVTANPPDPNLVGREYVVRGPLNKSATTTYRLPVDDTNDFGE